MRQIDDVNYLPNEYMEVGDDSSIVGWHKFARTSSRSFSYSDTKQPDGL